MRRSRLAVVASTSLVAAALALPLTASQSGAAPAAPAASAAPSGEAAAPRPTDSLTMPWQAKYEAERQVAVEKRLRNGGSGESQKIGKDTYGRVAQSGTDKIFVVLAEFGDTRHSAYPDGGTTEGQEPATTYDGPLHNEIPKPDRATDNSTLWQADYDRKHYRDMYFNRMRTFYEQQSSGEYSVDGDVTAWVKVPFNQARYGRNTCGDIVCNNTWFLIRDGLAQWTQDRLDAGQSMEQIQAYLETFDQQDRYDFDEDGDFSEPDGYIDHFQVVHAGGDEADGDPTYGEDAIWSHRWYAQIEPLGTGPADGAQLGGVNVGEGGVSDASGANVQIPDNPTGVWVGDYTIQPENGGLSVFAHEFGHDLGLPDLYDTSGNTGGASNSVEFWSLMSQSRGTLPGDPGIGDRPQPFGAWEKFQLGWLDYDVARAGRSSTHVLRPGQSTSGSAANGLITILPDKEVVSQLGEPAADGGERFYYSTSGNDLDTRMTAAVDGGGELTATTRYDIEEGWDYAYLEASSDGGETFAGVPTSVSFEGEDASGLNPDGTGISGTTDGAWVDLTATLPADTDTIRFRYRTDSAFVLSGFAVDNVAVDGETVGTAEEGDTAFELDGFTTSTGTEVEEFLNAYIVDNRQYVGRDKQLKHLYNFPDLEKKPDTVEFFRYAPGALISYWDTSYTDNNVGDHPGSGQVLPVDAHPDFVHYADDTLARTRVNTADSAFGLRRIKAQTLSNAGREFTVPARRAQPVFDDTRPWWFDSDEHGVGTHPGFYQPGWFGVDVPQTGTTIRVVKVAKNGNMTVKVGRSS